MPVLPLGPPPSQPLPTVGKASAAGLWGTHEHPHAVSTHPPPRPPPAPGAGHPSGLVYGRAGAAPRGRAGPTPCSSQPRPEWATHPRGPPGGPGRRQAPSPALTGVEQLFVAEAPAQGLGYPRRDGGRARERAGVGGAAQPSARPRLLVPERGASREPRVPGRRPPPSPGVSKPRGRPPAPPPLTFGARRAPSAYAGSGRLPPRALTHPPHGRARSDHAPGAPRSLARSLALTHAQPHAARGRGPLALLRACLRPSHRQAPSPWY